MEWSVHIVAADRKSDFKVSDETAHGVVHTLGPISYKAGEFSVRVRVDADTAVQATVAACEKFEAYRASEPGLPDWLVVELEACNFEQMEFKDGKLEDMFPFRTS